MMKHYCPLNQNENKLPLLLRNFLTRNTEIMQNAVNYAPYVYACRTSSEDATTFHVFVLVPIPKSKSVHFFHKSALGIERGIHIKENTLGIHLTAKRRRSEFGNRIVSKGRTFWAGYISLEYPDADSTPSDDYEYSINVHKNEDGQAENAIKVLFGEAEVLSSSDFNELKDGDFALACPYAYLYQKERKGQVTFFPQVLIPDVENIADHTTFEYASKEEGSTLVVPTHLVTADNIAIQVIPHTQQGASLVDVSATVDSDNNLLTVDYTPKANQLKTRVPRHRKKKKMKVRTKGNSM